MASTIVIVEDDHDIREALADILKREGYHVVEASNGAVAMDLLRNMTLVAGVILLDLMMPVMNGWQFRAEQLKDPKLAPLPVIAMSADANVPLKAQSIGVQHYLHKPIDIQELLDTLAKLCP